MKTNWKSGDIITAQKINNIINNSLNLKMNKNFICLNNYLDQDSYNSSSAVFLNMSFEKLKQLIDNNNFIYGYFNINNYTFFISSLFFEFWGDESTPGYKISYYDDSICYIYPSGDTSICIQYVTGGIA